MARARYNSRDECVATRMRKRRYVGCGIVHVSFSDHILRDRNAFDETTKRRRRQKKYILPIGTSFSRIFF